jgi:hypothetical protein
LVGRSDQRRKKMRGISVRMCIYREKGIATKKMPRAEE